MTIRLAKETDGPQLWALCEDFLASQTVYGGRDNRKALASVIAHGVKEGEAIVVAEERDELVGFCAWTAVPNGADGEVCGVGTFVVPHWRERGISHRMREYAKQHSREKGHKFVTGAVLLGNLGGMRSVEASGGAIVGFIVEWPL